MNEVTVTENWKYFAVEAGFTAATLHKAKQSARSYVDRKDAVQNGIAFFPNGFDIYRYYMEGNKMKIQKA